MYLWVHHMYAYHSFLFRFGKRGGFDVMFLEPICLTCEDCAKHYPLPHSHGNPWGRCFCIRFVADWRNEVPTDLQLLGVYGIWMIFMYFHGTGPTGDKLCHMPWWWIPLPIGFYKPLALCRSRQLRISHKLYRQLISNWRFPQDFLL